MSKEKKNWDNLERGDMLITGQYASAKYYVFAVIDEIVIFSSENNKHNQTPNIHTKQQLINNGYKIEDPTVEEDKAIELLEKRGRLVDGELV